VVYCKRAMAISIKIQCRCGQPYSFEVEPVGGRLPAPVFCPSCSADGTAAANEQIARALGLPAPPTDTPPATQPKLSLHLAHSPPTPAHVSTAPATRFVTPLTAA